MDKHEWRGVLRQAQAARDAPQVVSLSELFQALGIGFEDVQDWRVASYVPLGPEPIPKVGNAMVPRLFEADGTVLPAGVWGRNDQLESVRRGWPSQPASTACPDNIEVVLVPALAVDRSGVRLGKGGGWYDRALQSLTAPKVAVVYDNEIFPAHTLPKESHDVNMDGVVTPSGFELF